jgi:hypothetical protein
MGGQVMSHFWTNISLRPPVYADGAAYAAQ